MRDSYFLFLPLSVLSLASALAACSSSNNDPPADTCKEYVVPAGTNLTAPQVSFASDVNPIFKGSCALGGCHAAGTSNGVILAGDAKAVRGNIVGVKAPQTTGMKFVAAGDPKQSYLMHKLDGDQCTLNAQCEGGDCKTSMPQGMAALSVEKRDAIRRWIAQGAQDN